MEALGRNRVFDMQSLEEFRQGGVQVLTQAQQLSTELAAQMREVQALCNAVPAEAKQPGLSDEARQVAVAISEEDYTRMIQRIQSVIGRLTSEIPSVDDAAAEAQRQAVEMTETAGQRIQELADLLDEGALNLSYDGFKERLVECQEEMEKEVLDIREKLKKAADTMCGLQKYAAVYSLDPVHMATGNLYYEKEGLTIEQSPIRFFLYYNSMNRRKGSLLRNWSHSGQIHIKDADTCPVLEWEDGSRYYFSEEEEDCLRSPQHPGMKLYRERSSYTLERREGEELSLFGFNSFGWLEWSRSATGILIGLISNCETSSQS